jgi:hypothetical protein
LRAARLASVERDAPSIATGVDGSDYPFRAFSEVHPVSLGY